MKFNRYRYTHNTENLAFNGDIVKSKLIINPKADLSQLCVQYHTTLKSLLDKQAPVRSKSAKIKLLALWMSPDIINATVCRRYLERTSAKSRTENNRSRYTKQCHFCNRLMNKAKSNFCRNMISNNSDNPRQR